MTMALVSGQWRYKGYIVAYLVRKLATVGNAKRKTIYHYIDYPMQYRNSGDNLFRGTKLQLQPVLTLTEGLDRVT